MDRESDPHIEGVNKVTPLASGADETNRTTTTPGISAISVFHMGEPLKLELRLLSCNFVAHGGATIVTGEASA